MGTTVRPNTMVKTKLRVNDVVRVLCGKDKGKEGRVLDINAHRNTVTVSGISMVKKAMRRQKQEDKGGVVDIERPFHLSNVQIISKGKRSRMQYVVPTAGGKKKRKAIKTGELV